MNYDDALWGRVEREVGREARNIARDFGEVLCFATLRMVFRFFTAAVTSTLALASLFRGVHFDVKSAFDGSILPVVIDRPSMPGPDEQGSCP